MRERDKKREEKALEKRINDARKAEAKIAQNAEQEGEDKESGAEQAQIGEINLQNEQQLNQNATHKSLFQPKDTTIDSRVRQKPDKAEEKSHLQKLLDHTKKHDKISLNWARENMFVQLRDRNHRYYNEKCVIRRINNGRDEICLETLGRNQRRLYLPDIKKSEQRLKRVVPCTIGSRVAIIDKTGNAPPRFGRLKKYNENGNLEIIVKGKSVSATVQNVCKVVAEKRRE